MDKEQRLLLEHVGNYTITIGKVVETVFPDVGRTALARLVRDGLIQRIANGLDGGLSYYQLTAKGAKLCDLPVNRSRPKEAKGLALDLATVWFACMGEQLMKRLSFDELKTLFGAPKGGNIVHVAQDGEDEETVVFRVFVPSAGSPLRSFLPTLKKSAFDIVGDEKLLRWVERGTYGLAVLVHNEDRREDLADLIRNEEFPDIRIHLDVAPTTSNLREFINPEKENDLYGA